jgi:hypothetical protein
MMLLFSFFQRVLPTPTIVSPLFQFATQGAATVEMASLVDDFDIVVIDEIQMISDPERGFAWTKALLGSRCKEIHICGGMEVSAQSI